MIALLIAYGADVNLADEDGNTPLMLAVRESPVSWECVEALVFFGAKYSIFSYGYYSPLLVLYLINANPL